MSPQAALKELVMAIGPYSAIGAVCIPPVSAQAVGKWGEKGIPPDRVIQLAKATSYRVTPHALRPDIYPSPDDGLPPELKGRAAA